jgi:adenylate cyclase
MPIEIERKFLVIGTEWRRVKGIRYSQGYLCRDKGRTIRVRLAGDKAFFTIKGVVKGISRPEFEYEIPISNADQLLKLCDGAVIEKKRHVINYKSFKWEVDEFLGDNAGLVIAEIELEREDQEFERPGWVGSEVTGDPRYYNANLTSKPYCTWRDLEAGKG